jgi:hypothetical protein
MRVVPALAFALALAVPAATFAAPVSDIQVTLGPKLLAKAKDKNYGQRDLDYLTTDLKNAIQRSLKAKGELGRGRRLEVVIEDATPNRPTFGQMSANPSLSMRSVGVGGATVRGHLGGQEISYSYWATDIRDERGSATWTDAENAFDGFAHKVADAR